MAAAMISDRGLRKKLTQELAMPDKPPRKPAKRKPTPSSSKDKKSEQNNNQSKKPKVSTGDPKLDLFNTYQPWVIQTYGDQAKTKTITLKKYSRILKVLRGEECNTSDSSKFRFWVKAKGFNLGAPSDYEAKPADGIVCRYSVRDAEGCARNPDGTEVYSGSQNDPALYVPTPPLKSDPPDEPTVFRKVAIVENFFDIIYTVHVELEGRDGKHAGQKRTYRTITETYAFLPREAVTRFLAGCAECARRPRSASPHPAALPLLTPSPSPTYPQTFLHYPQEYTKNWESEIDAQKPSVYDFTEPQPHTPSPKNVQDDKPVYIELTPKPKINGIKDILKNTPPSTPAENTVRKDPEIDKDEENSLIDIEDLKSNSPPPMRQEEAKVESLNETLKNFVMPTADEKIADKKIGTKKPYNPLDVCNLTSKDPPKSGTPPKKRLYSKPDHINGEPRYPKCWAPDMCLYFSNGEEIDYSVPITTAYLKHMRNLGHQDLKDFDKKDNIGSDLNEANDDDTYSGQAFTKDAEKLKMMLLAWNYHSQSQGRNGDVTDSAGADMAELWASYHSALGLAKPPKVPTPSPQRDQTSPVQVSGSSTVEASAHDETSSSAGGTGKDDDDAMGGSDDDSDDRVDPQHHDPERLKAFNMFVRLFVDENLDRIIPISKQPKEKIQAIIDSCTRQFPEFAERARKRIRTYLKSCRRNKKVRGDVNPTGNGSSSGGTGNAWDSAVRPTPAHLTSVQAEHILAQACENESMNAKRMRLGLDPVSQPLPSGHANAMDTTTPSSVASSFLSLYSAAAGSPALPTSGASSAPAASTHNKPVPDSTRPSASPTLDSQLLNNNCLKHDNANGSTGSKTVSPASSPSPMFRPSFPNAFGSQHTFGRQSSSNINTPAASALTNTALLSTLTAMPNAGVGMNAAAVAAYQSALLSAMAAQTHTFPNLTAPTDLSMKTVTTSTPLHAISSSVSGSLTSTPAPKTPLLSHKLSGAEVGAVRQLITGYRESAAFLLRSADELEALLLQQP